MPAWMPRATLTLIPTPSRFRVNLARIRRSRPDSGLALQAKGVETFKVAPCSLRSGLITRWGLLAHEGWAGGDREREGLRERRERDSRLRALGARERGRLLLTPSSPPSVTVIYALTQLPSDPERNMAVQARFWL